jgi:hypothetical protein
MELDQAWPELAQIDGIVKDCLNGSHLFQKLALEEPQPFHRREIVPGAVLYSSGNGRRQKKTLLVCFGTMHNQLLIPISWFLQYLPARDFDVLLLLDSRRDFFRRGIEGVPLPVPAMIGVLRRLVPFGSYGRVVTYGTSMGALSALTAGTTLGADRAIAIGAVFHWTIRIVESGTPMDAFNLICHCRRPTSGEYITAYSEKHERDAGFAEQVRRTLGAKVVVIDGEASHNLIYRLVKRGELAAFLSKTIGYKSNPPLRQTPPTSFSQRLQAGFMRSARRAGRRLEHWVFRDYRVS